MCSGNGEPRRLTCTWKSLSQGLTGAAPDDRVRREGSYGISQHFQNLVEQKLKHLSEPVNQSAHCSRWLARAPLKHLHSRDMCA